MMKLLHMHVLQCHACTTVECADSLLVSTPGSDRSSLICFAILVEVAWYSEVCWGDKNSRFEFSVQIPPMLSRELTCMTSKPAQGIKTSLSASRRHKLFCGPDLHTLVKPESRNNAPSEGNGRLFMSQQVEV